MSDFLGKSEKLLKAAAKVGKTQTDARDEVVDIITTMCDSLESASDIVSSEISKAITDINRARRGTENQLVTCFNTQAVRFRHEKLLGKLRAGKVCSDLKKLGKRFGDPLSKQALGAQPFKQWVKAAVGRSSTMQQFVEDLYLDERRYIEDFRDKLDEVALLAENAAGEINRKELVRSADEINKRLKKVRKEIRQKADSLRSVADDCLNDIL